MGVSKSAISRVVGVECTPKNFNAGNAAMLPQRLAIIGQGNDDAVYTVDKYVCEGSADDVAKRYGYGSPLHLAARQLFPEAGLSASFPVTIYPVKMDLEASAKASGSITVTVSGADGKASKNGSGKVSVAGIDAEFVIMKGQTAQEISASIIKAVNGVLYMPVVAKAFNEGAVPLEAKWSGKLGNDITVSVDCECDGVTVAVTSNLSGGSGVPSVSGALAGINQVWETFILNTFSYKETSVLDEYYEFGIGRWSVLEKKPCLVASGCTDGYAERTAVTKERPSDYINFLITSVGSPELPLVVAAKGLLSDIITTADANPPQGYKGLLSGLKAGNDKVQESYAVRNMSIQEGASTNIKSGSVAELNDIVTMYHPESEGKYPYRRYVVDLVKLMNIVYNVRLIMESDEKKGAPLVPDKDVTTNKSAIQPKMVKGELVNLADSLSRAAIISDAEFTRKRIEVDIDSENPKRLNATFPCKLSGNVEVVSADIYFGFYLGGN